MAIPSTDAPIFSPVQIAVTQEMLKVWGLLIKSKWSLRYISTLSDWWCILGTIVWGVLAWRFYNWCCSIILLEDTFANPFSFLGRPRTDGRMLSVSGLFPFFIDIWLTFHLRWCLVFYISNLNVSSVVHGIMGIKKKGSQYYWCSPWGRIIVFFDNHHHLLQLLI